MVYLTPFSKNNIIYNPEDIYVISPYHETTYHIPQRHSEVRTAKLPYNFTWRQRNQWMSLAEVCFPANKKF